VDTVRGYEERPDDQDSRTLLLWLLSALRGMWFVVAATLGEEGFAFATERGGYAFTQHLRFIQQVIKMPKGFADY
jgi:hypothetical protein